MNKNNKLTFKYQNTKIELNRFQEFAIRDMLTHDGFKESVGIFGIDSLSFLSDRMFVIMDQNEDGRIFLEEYLGYFEIMLHGTKDEKMK